MYCYFVICDRCLHCWCSVLLRNAITIRKTEILSLNHNRKLTLALLDLGNVYTNTPKNGLIKTIGEIKKQNQSQK